MTRVNDAVAKPSQLHSGTSVSISRVVAVAEDGRVVVDDPELKPLKMEEAAGEWPVVGHFEQRGFFRRWVFVATESDKTGIPLAIIGDAS